VYNINVNLPPLKNADVNGKTVFLRADIDIPLSEIRNPKSEIRNIEDDTRLKAALPTIEYLLQQNCKIIIGGHLRRPKGIDKKLSLEPVALWLCHKLKIKNEKLKIKLGDFDAWQLADNILIVENLRFYPGEEKNDREFSKNLASLAQIYVNDAFAMSHRNHASIVGITHFLPHFAGFHLQKEVETLSHVMENPKRPLVVIVGGKKIETKLPLVEKMHKVADYVLVGGKIAEESKALVNVQHEKITGKKAVLLVADAIPDGSDITDKDAENFLQIISLAKTIIWNGSMGIIENEKLMGESTRKIALGIIKSGAYSVVGGGDTVEFLNKLGVLDKFSFASTGGGAMLAFLSGEKLPGIEALLQ